MMRGIVKKLFEKKRGYLRIRYNRFVYALWLLTRKDVKKLIDSKTLFYRKVLGKNHSLFYDIGANEGVLTKIFSRLSKQVIAIEPATRNVNILKARFHNHKVITILQVAVSNQNEEQIWYEDPADYAMGTLSKKWTEIKNHENDNKHFNQKIQTITLDNLVNRFGLPGFVKIDVEGSERLVLEGLSFIIPLLSFEAILPQFIEETIWCIEHLHTVSNQARFNFSAEDCFEYKDYVEKEILITHIKKIDYTIDIWCKM